MLPNTPWSTTPVEEAPLRAELFSAAQMEQHGRVLAGWHKVHQDRSPDLLLPRLADNERQLESACAMLTIAVRERRDISPAAEWLLDNFYLIQEQIRTAKRHLPKGYSKELPRLLKGPSKGLPRVYDIALETISHGDGRVDPESLSRFVSAYQDVTRLRLGELWAIPIMLRLALIENLRRVSVRVAASRGARDAAGEWADKMIEAVEHNPSSLILLVADMARSGVALDGPFVAELARRLQGQSPALTLPLTWVAQRLSESGATIEHLVQAEAQLQAAEQVSISNSIGSLRFLHAMDWREFVETMSHVEQTLRGDPADRYNDMAFATRDSYRHVIERLARWSGKDETEVAEKAIELAITAAAVSPLSRPAHVGYYLVHRGRPALELAIGARLPLRARLARRRMDTPLRIFLGSVGLLTMLFTALVMRHVYLDGVRDVLFFFTLFLVVLTGSQLGVSLVNWISGVLATPEPLPRMDFSEGIPSVERTMVVIPTMLLSAANIDSLVDGLEVRYLANRDPALRFCLLTDLADASRETLPRDAALVQQAVDGIRRLNQTYGNDAVLPFLLLHRGRQWNEQEQTWMGYERKRGKLGALNALLRERPHAREAFSVIEGETSDLANIRYVITLDTDTQLPRDAARQFVAAMAHPLNKPKYDPVRQRVTEGYGILQPRVAASLPAHDTSIYEKLSGADAGIDPYTLSVSDVYQDLFHEGSFIGKGIYDVDAFELALHDKLPENQILSHDLLEGCYARAGLLSDVQLLEDSPSRYRADVSRRHRWIRGDWQLLAWLFPRVPTLARTPDGFEQGSAKNPLSALSRWKIFDNLRRSLVAPALTLLLILGWTVLPTPWLWSVTAIVIVLLPTVVAAALELARKPRDVLPRQHISQTMDMLGRGLLHNALHLAFLPYEAFYSLDAILRTLWRMLVSKRRMLEWVPSNVSSAMAGDDLPGALRSMWVAPVLGAATYLMIAGLSPWALAAALPFLALWYASPAIAWWISRPQPGRRSRLEANHTVFLHRLARKTWAFFETYVGDEDNWLPPDNMQEHPVAVVAHRTSPTNIGLALLANMTAWDFGYIQAGQMLTRIDNTLLTMERLERHRGHFYNWYDTVSLKPLHPMYVSTVDSGNLAGHLLVLRAGLQMMADQPLLPARLFTGLAETYLVLFEMSQGRMGAKMSDVRRLLDVATSAPPAGLLQAVRQLDAISAATRELADSLVTDVELPHNWWANALAKQAQEALADLLHLAPWLADPKVAELSLALPPLNSVATLRELARLQDHTDALFSSSGGTVWGALPELVAEGCRRAGARITQAERLAAEAERYSHMEFDFLFDRGTRLLSIGYNVSERRRDNSFYDLLASEARLACFLAIAQGQLPQEAWFALGRQRTVAGGEPLLLSWSGSMFEYLMPLLVMPTYENTLLDQTYHAVVHRQMEFGEQRSVPWGISESGYHAFDASLNYQYRAFGVPGTGLKRGLGDDLVVAPYASMMALMVAPEEACENLQRISREGFEGKFGMHEAIDYTPSRLPRGQSFALIRSYMAHHQGMGFLSLAYVLLDQPMQKRFEADPQFQSTLLLLKERIPKPTAYFTTTSELHEVRAPSGEHDMPTRVFNRVDTRTPEVQLLSNGRYHVMVSAAGGSYSRWRDLAVTRWREDATRDHWGSFCYVRDLADNSFWSNTFQPTQKTPQQYEAIFSEGRAEFRRRDNGLDMHTEIVVSPEDDIELRRLKITNRSRNGRSIDVTSFAEVVLAPAAADSAHPAFSNLFVQTEILADRHTILCTRRARSEKDFTPTLFHLMEVHGADSQEVSFETDRMLFIGRGHTAADPSAMDVAALSGSSGSVLDPVAAVRHRFRLAPEQTVTIDMVTGMAETRDGALALVEKYRDLHLAARVFELAWTHGQVILRQLNASEADAQLYSRLANSIVYANPSMRAEAAVLSKNRRGQSGLWSYAISGDLPIVLLQISAAENIELVRQMVQAHAYWRMKGLAVDLVIWNEDRAGYRQVLQEQIMGLVASGIEPNAMERPGGIFVRMADQIPAEDRILLQTVARAIISDQRGTLAEQISRRAHTDIRVPQLLPSRTGEAAYRNVPVAIPELMLGNGLGGFSQDGREYIIVGEPGSMTPAPWCNVIANAHFGSVVSEAGQSYTWGENAHEFRLTPWANDPVSDGGGEAFYLRDEESGRYWSPSALPRRGSGRYLTRHGFGYSVFEHAEEGIHTALTMYVALDAAVKFSVLKIRNDAGAARRLSATGYVEWVMGDLRQKSTMHITTEADPVTGALFARNPYNAEFSDRIAFFYVDAANLSVTGDRSEFIGRNGSLAEPAAMARVKLSGKLGAGLDPCAAIQLAFDLADGEEREIVFMLGVAARRSADVSNLIQRFRGGAAAKEVLSSVQRYWDRTLGAVQIETPDPALNVLTNGWLMYQTLACRIWARSGFYQSGGAYGFRDQLQDVMALVHTQPALAREHLLRSAAHQFVEGDVQHWWHPPADRGVRTHCSDDYLWLPLATSRYVTAVRDTGVLDEMVHFLQGRAVNPDEDSYYDLPGRSAESATLYEHCVRAIRNGLRYGVHGLPLIGSCDWNDGMDKVGEHGKGESVWLAFFLYEVLQRFIEIAELRADSATVELCRVQSEQLKANIELNAWDGNWYRRAYFDNGVPLGSASNEECQIDSISQSWSVLSGAGDPERSKSGMAALDQRLVKRDAALIQLLDPPFDKAGPNPGYIRGYVPGVRENGGQYTHAAIWAAMAFARMGENDKAWELLRMINPVNHGSDPASVAVYKVEPYVVAADVYGVAPHVGRGGWTWYTGSSGWLYRLIVESLLGLSLRNGEELHFAPCLPGDWAQYKLSYRFRDTTYQVTIVQRGAQHEGRTLYVDGSVVQEDFLRLVDDRVVHKVELVIGTP